MQRAGGAALGRCLRCGGLTWPPPARLAASAAALSSSAGPSPPASQLKRHKRQLSPLEQAAAIAEQMGAAGPKQQQQQQPRERMPRLAAAAQQQPSSGLPGLPPLPPPPAVAQLAARGKQKRRVGALQGVPVISPPEELAASALKRSLRVAPGAGIKNEAEKERSRAAKQLDTHMKELSVPLTRWLKGFPAPASLHPFEAALLDLTVGTATYTSVLAKADALRKSIQEVGKGFAARASGAANKRAAAAVAEEGSAALAGVFSKGAKALEDLKRVSRALRSLPYVDPLLPTLALVGAPNVGKSSLVRALSSGAPEVCNYPFTTRSIKMGHFYIDAARHQVTDTPGLLSRPDEQRNKMELLTLAALQHLPSAVLFVADLTEECGTSVAEQWAIREELRQRFPAKPWVDVLSKADLLGAVWAQADAALAQPRSSCSSSSSQDGGASAPAFAAALPGAVRVSALTEAGLPELQAALTGCLRSADAVLLLADAQQQAAADAQQQQPFIAPLL